MNKTAWRVAYIVALSGIAAMFGYAIWVVASPRSSGLAVAGLVAMAGILVFAVVRQVRDWQQKVGADERAE